MIALPEMRYGGRARGTDQEEERGPRQPGSCAISTRKHTFTGAYHINFHHKLMSAPPICDIFCRILARTRVISIT